MFRISDRAVGYASFIALIFIFAAVSFGMWKAHQATIYTLTADFQELGSLQPEDKATVRGQEVGRVKTVEWLGDRSRVTVVLDEPLTVREGTIVKNSNYAIMGQRQVEIILNKHGKVLPADYVHQGIFEPGLTESLRLIDEILAQVMAIREAALLFLEGDSSHASFPKTFDSMLQNVEATVGQVEGVAAALPGQLDGITSTIDTVSNTVKNVSDEAEGAVASIDSVAKVKIGEAKDMLATIAEKADQADAFIEDFKNSKIGDLLENDSLARQMMNLVLQIEDLVDGFRSNGLAIKDSNGNELTLVKWSNINLIGETARAKARKRLEEAKKQAEERRGK